MKINIQYPPLIEQAYNHLLSIGLHPNKDKLNVGMYHHLAR